MNEMVLSKQTSGELSPVMTYWDKQRVNLLTKLTDLDDTTDPFNPPLLNQQDAHEIKTEVLPRYSRAFEPALSNEIVAEIEALLLHYYNGVNDVAASKRIIQDWIEALHPFPIKAIQRACADWKAEEERKPVPAAIRKRVEKIVNRRKLQVKRLQMIVEESERIYGRKRLSAAEEERLRAEELEKIAASYARYKAGNKAYQDHVTQRGEKTLEEQALELDAQMAKDEARIERARTAKQRAGAIALAHETAGLIENIAWKMGLVKGDDPGDGGFN